MIDNEHIESISKLENSHILLVVKEKSRMKLSSYIFEDSIKYSDPYYKARGWLELFDIDSVKLFLAVNKRHLSEEICKSILEDAEKVTFNSSNTNFANTQHSLFASSKEKIPLKKLQILKQWAENFLNPKKYSDFSPTVFKEIFRVIIFFDKREKVEASSLWIKDMQENGDITIRSLYDQIGPAYKKYFDFVSICMTLSNYPGKLEKLAKEPQVLGNNWDILNDDNDNYLKYLLDWLQSIIYNKKNPVDGSELSNEDIVKLKASSDILLRSYQMLKPEMQKSLALNN